MSPNLNAKHFWDFFLKIFCLKLFRFFFKRFYCSNILKVFCSKDLLVKNNFSSVSKTFFVADIFLLAQNLQHVFDDWEWRFDKFRCFLFFFLWALASNLNHIFIYLFYFSMFLWLFVKLTQCKSASKKSFYSEHFVFIFGEEKLSYFFVFVTNFLENKFLKIETKTKI